MNIDLVPVLTWLTQQLAIQIGTKILLYVCDNFQTSA